MARRSKLKQIDLWGNPVEEPRSPSEIIPLDFETHAVRVVMIRGEPWWALSDVARVLGYPRPRDAARILREKEKGAHRMRTLGGDQELSIVNESGLYRLIMRSNKPEAERFQDWVTEEVLPSIRKTGGYSVKDRVGKLASRLGCDRKTAEIRAKEIDFHKSMHGRLKSKGAVPNDYRDRHNATYRGQFGKECSELRGSLRIGPRHTPLDRMSGIVLAQNYHAKFLAEKLIETSAAPMSLKEEDAVYEKAARSIAESDLGRIGDGAHFAVIEDSRRGAIIDVVRPALAAV